MPSSSSVIAPIVSEFVERSTTVSLAVPFFSPKLVLISKAKLFALKLISAKLSTEAEATVASETTQLLLSSTSLLLIIAKPISTPLKLNPLPLLLTTSTPKLADTFVIATPKTSVVTVVLSLSVISLFVSIDRVIPPVALRESDSLKSVLKVTSVGNEAPSTP